MPKVIQVIESEEPIGKGVDGDPIRIAIRYYTLKGDFLAEHDTWADDPNVRKAREARNPAGSQAKDEKK